MVHTILAALVLAAQLSDPSAAPAVVSGRVVDADSGRAIAGAVVMTAGPAASLERGALGPVRVMTTATGQFSFRDLRKGELVITVTKPGYVNATYGQRRPGGSTQPITVKPGERINGLDVRMWKHAAITGTVIDELGDPVVGTRVQVLAKQVHFGRYLFARVTGGMDVTDDRGMYRVAGLTPGDYIVSIPSTQVSVPPELMNAFFTGPPLTRPKRLELSRELNAVGSAIAPSGSSFALDARGQTFSLPPGTLTPQLAPAGIVIYPTVYFPASASAAHASVVTLKSGEERSGVDMQPSPVRGAMIAGTLTGPDGPVSTTAVRLLPAVADALVEPAGVAATVSDFSGAFVFPAVPPGSYVISVVRLPRAPVNPDDLTHVSVTPGGSATVSSNRVDPPAGPAPVPPDATLVAQMPIAVGDHNLADLIVPLTPAPRLTGSIDFEGTRDKPSPKDILNMRIVLVPTDGRRPGNDTLRDETGRAEPDGVFKTYGVPPGSYLVQMQTPPDGWFVKSVMYQGRDVSDVPLDLGAKDAAGAVITFTDRPAALNGVVQGREGPDGTAVVIAFPTDDARWPTALRRIRTVRVKSNGTFTLDDLPAGEYYVAAVKEDMVEQWNDPALLRALVRIAQTVRLTDGERKTVALTAAEVK